MHGSPEFAEVFFDDVVVPDVAHARRRRPGLVRRHGLAALRTQHRAVASRRDCCTRRLDQLLEQVADDALTPIEVGEVFQQLYAFRARSRATQYRMARGDTLGAETSIDKILLATTEQAVFDLAAAGLPDAVLTEGHGGARSSSTRAPRRSTAAVRRFSATSSPAGCSTSGPTDDGSPTNVRCSSRPSPTPSRRATPASKRSAGPTRSPDDPRAAVSIWFEAQGLVNGESRPATVTFRRKTATKHHGLRARALAHELIGASRAMLSLAREHALERVQFGVPIASFQAVRHRLAETLVAIEAAQAAVDARVGRRHRLRRCGGQGRRRAVTPARSAKHCQQVLAGIGFTARAPVPPLLQARARARPHATATTVRSPANSARNCSRARRAGDAAALSRSVWICAPPWSTHPHRTTSEAEVDDRALERVEVQLAQRRQQLRRNASSRGTRRSCGGSCRCGPRSRPTAACTRSPACAGPAVGAAGSRSPAWGSAATRGSSHSHTSGFGGHSRLVCPAGNASATRSPSASPPGPSGRNRYCDALRVLRQHEEVAGTRRTSARPYPSRSSSLRSAMSRFCVAMPRRRSRR